MCEAGYTVLLQGASEWIWMRRPLLTCLNRQVMPLGHSESGIMECSIPTIRSVGDLIISTDSVPDIGDITTMPSWKETENWFREKGFCVDDFTTDAMSFHRTLSEQGETAFLCSTFPIILRIVRCRCRTDGGINLRIRKLEDMMRNRNPERRKIVCIFSLLLAMCENIDWNVGRLLKKLDQLEATDDTIVVFLSR